MILLTAVPVQTHCQNDCIYTERTKPIHANISLLYTYPSIKTRFVFVSFRKHRRSGNNVNEVFSE